MSRNTLNKLTDRQCKAAKPRDKTYKLSDGGGLYLEVSQTGSKYWRMKYRRPSDKKEDRLAFGVYRRVKSPNAGTNQHWAIEGREYRVNVPDNS